MTRQVARVDVAVKDLLAFARPATPKFAPVDINETVERALTLVRPTADSAGVHLEVNAGDVPPVFIDEEMISQSLVNLVMNGIQAAETDGRVTVGTRSVQDWVEIRIEDTGEGIPPDQIDHIFKPFFTTKHQGTGLGLSITRTIIERHNGTLAVECRDGEGAAFTVVLPLGDDGNTEEA
jgi:signal transduction histidine kinase